MQIHSHHPRTARSSLVIGLILLCCSGLHAVELGTELVTGGLSNPVGVTYAPGDASRLFVIEQHTARVRIIKDGVLLAQPFLDLKAEGYPVHNGYETGLLGIAFRPDYQTSGVFFVRYTDTGYDDHLLRYKVSGNPDLADTNSDRTILIVPSDQNNHNGGWMDFSPLDGYLYSAYGDGGGGGDNHGSIGNAQATNNLLGTIIRIDVGDGYGENGQPAYGIPADNPTLVGRDNNGNTAGITARPEIMHYGLRNPWRCSFDRDTGDLWIGDVGQNEIEEISFAPAGAKGLNFGWKIMEGTRTFHTNNHLPPNDPSLTPPVMEYDHTQARAIIGGYVYRGSEIPALQGTYLNADFATRSVWGFNYDGSSVTNFTNYTTQVTSRAYSSFGEDLNGELYLCDHGNNRIYKIIQVGGPVAPSFTSTPPSTAVVNIAYSYDANAIGDDTIVYSLDTAPAGMSINSSTGMINWTPSTGGDVNVTVRASNGVNPDATQSFIITVEDLRQPENPALADLSTGLNVATFEGNWDSVPAFAGLTAVNATTHPRPDVGPRPRDNDFALHFSGFINVPQDGTWTFQLDGHFGGTTLLNWPFDSNSGTTAVDSSGNYDGTITGATWTSGARNSALSFSGAAGDQVESLTAGAAINGLDAVTIAMWIKSNETTSDRGFLFGNAPNGNDAGFALRYDAGGFSGGGTNVLKGAITTTTGNYQIETSSNVQTTAWQHVVMTWQNGGPIEIYLNGTLDTPSYQDTTTVTGTITSLDRLLIGRGGKDGSASWNGLIDEVRLYPFKVTSSDVIAIMGHGAPAGALANAARIRIGSEVVVDSDVGMSGTIPLGAGRHQVAVELMQQQLDNDFGVSWSGPGTALASVPDANWLRYTNSFGLDVPERSTAYLNMPTTEGGGLPATLSATGVFSDTASLTPAEGVVPYMVNTPLWSDGANKFRWISVPANTSITFSSTGNWLFPPGTVMVKHFAIGAEERPLETRLSVVQEDGTPYLVTYRWRADRSDADLLDAAGLTETVSFDGGQTQVWAYPSRANCADCHTAVTKGVLGVRARQQNGVVTYASTGRSDNQLRTWNHLGFFDIDVDDSVIANTPALANIADVSRSLEDRARSYLDSNCMQCHQPGGTAPANFDLRYDTPLADQGIIHGSLNNDLGIDGARTIRRRDTARSMIYHRQQTTDPATRMPPLGRTINDDAALTVLADWINSLAAERQISVVNQTGFQWDIDPAAPSTTTGANDTSFEELDSSADHVLQPLPGGSG